MSSNLAENNIPRILNSKWEGGTPVQPYSVA